MDQDEMQKKFPLGSKVRLNVGGPTMAVTHLSTVGSATVTCQWFVGKKLEKGTFAPETLEIVEEEKAEAKPKS